MLSVFVEENKIERIEKEVNERFALIVTAIGAQTSRLVSEAGNIQAVMNYPAASGRSIKPKTKKIRPKGRGIYPNEIKEENILTLLSLIEKYKKGLEQEIFAKK